jgi:uncharacterized DUF497 family protein
MDGREWRRVDGGVRYSACLYTAWPYMTWVDIEFDTAKDETNRLKHGMPLALGAVVLMNMVGRIEDDRCDYGERRFNAFGLVDRRLLVCTYTTRGDTYRLISVRKASEQERRTWLR